MKRTGILLLGIALIFGSIETMMFGFNFIPHSDAEKLADAITLSLCVIGLVLRIFARQ